MQLRQYAYVSHSRVNDMSSPMLAILRSALNNNTRDNITGYLHVEDMHFFQIVEGHEPLVEALVSRLKSDTRHSNFSTLIDRRITARSFPDWHMGLASNNGLKLKQEMHGETPHVHAVDSDTLFQFMQKSSNIKRVEMDRTYQASGETKRYFDGSTEISRH